MDARSLEGKRVMLIKNGVPEVEAAWAEVERLKEELYQAERRHNLARANIGWTPSGDDAWEFSKGGANLGVQRHGASALRLVITVAASAPPIEVVFVGDDARAFRDIVAALTPVVPIQSPDVPDLDPEATAGPEAEELAEAMTKAGIPAHVPPGAHGPVACTHPWHKHPIEDRPCHDCGMTWAELEDRK